jgi:NAD(P)-dependent dehydrogenase (short-subunit alcohol dehydrogenase family)
VLARGRSIVSRIASRRFSVEDQLWFASQSGDWNPVHVDAIEARRTVAGELVVHGTHALIWALDAHLATGGGVPAAVNATFFKPSPVDADITLERTVDTDGTVWLEATRGGDVLFSGHIVPGPVPVSGSQALAPRNRPRQTPRVLSFDEVKDAAGVSPIEADADALSRIFPRACNILEQRRVAALMTLSQIVGMECPGLHSLLSGVDVRFDVSDPSPAIEWRVTRHRLAAAPIRIAVSGGGLAGTVAALVRPAPVEQLTAAEMKARVTAGEFAGQHALVIGGSRGLGEVVAKAVAAGGGKVTLTYHAGEADARRVAADIESIGRTCGVEHFDATSADAAARERLVTAGATHLYYFATPRIGAGRAGRFDSELWARFHAAYVDGFAHLVFAAADFNKKLRVFYPSSVFVNEVPSSQMEYVAAKAAGEMICRLVARQYPNIGILASRLPRMTTDQTVSLLGAPPRSAVGVMLTVIRRLHHLANGLTIDDDAA